MRRIINTLCLAGVLAMPIAWQAGCDREVAHETRTEVDEDKVTTKETTVRETPQGNIEVEKKKTTEEYDDNEVERSTETETKTYPR